MIQYHFHHNATASKIFQKNLQVIDFLGKHSWSQHEASPYREWENIAIILSSRWMLSVTHMWQKNHNMEFGWVIIIIPPKDWKGSRCPFTNEAIRKARDPREINGRTITGNPSSSFYSFNIHIKNQWSWRMSGIEKWSWALNFIVMWDHLHTINLKKFCEKQGFDPFNGVAMWE